LVGVAFGGSLSGYVAERLHWRASFWMLGGAGVLFALPLYRFLRSLPAEYVQIPKGEPARLSSFLGLLKIPSLRLVTTFVAVATFALFLVYTWLPTLLYDKFQIGLARAAFEASVYPQVGTAFGLLVGSFLADRNYRRHPSARFWVVCSAFFGAAPCIYLLGINTTLGGARIAAMGFGFFSGFIIGNQAAASFDVVPPALRASTVGVLNFLGAMVSGFAPYLGGVVRSNIGVGRIMGFTGILYVFTGLYVVFGTLRHFARDHARSLAGSADAVTEPPATRV
jgi:predicted MFS family arabinose efflux permease